MSVVCPAADEQKKEDDTGYTIAVFILLPAELISTFTFP